MAETVALLFSDVEGSTRLLSGLGAQRYGELLAAYRSSVESAATAEGGTVVDREGDGLFIAFPTAAAALRAALAAQQALAATEWPDGGQVRARMGLHAGEAERRPDGWVGLAVHRAARVAAAANGGQVLVSEATRLLTADELPSGAGLRDLGEHRLKDLERRERLYQLTAPDLAAEFPPLRTLDALPNNLPVQVTRFVGRERELATVGQLIGESRLVTLTGVGGTGKSRLAFQAGAEALGRHGDGVWVVELAALTDPGGVVGAIAATLGIRERQADETADRASLVDRVTEYLTPRELLLMLDNCEHLLDEVSQLVDRLLSTCPRLRILATSREGLGIPGETTWRVPSLSLSDGGESSSDAVELFAERARAALPSFALSDANLPTVVEICRRLDGLPLAIELAAARVRVLGLDDLAARLGDRFRLLTGGSRTALPRQQTLEATIDWSYQLLTDAERALFARLSVFAGGFTLAAAEEVGAGGAVTEGDVMDLVFHLVDKSLVIPIEGPAGPTRYRMLESLRQYGGARLAASGEVESVRDRHRDHFLRLAEQVREHPVAAARTAWLEQLELEHDNLRAALEWSTSSGNDHAASVVAAALGRYMFEEGQYHRAVDYWRGAVQHAPTVGGPLWEAEARFHLAVGLPSIGQADEALEQIARARDLVDGSPPSPVKVRILARYAGILAGHVRHSPTEAVEPARQAVADARSLGDAALLSLTLHVLGNAVAWAGDADAGATHMREALRLAREAGDEDAVGDCSALLLYIVHDLAHRADESDELAAQIRAWLEASETGDWSLWGGLAYFHLRRGDWTAVEEIVARMERYHLEGFRRAWLLQVRGALRWMQGQLTEAEADAQGLRALGIDRWDHDLYPLLAEIAAAAGRLADVRRWAQEYTAKEVDPSEQAMKAAVLAPLVRAEVDAALAASGAEAAEHAARAADGVRQAEALLARFPPALNVQFESPDVSLLVARAELSRVTGAPPEPWQRLTEDAWYAYTRLYARWRLAEAMLASGREEEGRRQLEAAHREARDRGAQLIARQVEALAARRKVSLDEEAGA